MKAVILAAGIAARLRPLTEHTPKCLLDVGGETILGRTLNSLRANNVSEFVIVTGYLENQIRDYVSQEFSDLSVTFISNPDYATTNNIYSLWLTREAVLDDDMLLLDSDILFDSRIVGLLMHTKHDNCLAITTGKPLGHEEIKVRVDDKGALVEISKEVPPESALGESIGIEKFSRLFLNRLFEVLDRKISLEKHVSQFYEAAFQEVIDAGQRLFAVDVGDLSCIEIDTIEDLGAARSLVSAKPD